ncbi:MAG: glycoside hydrolase family 16 protein [Flavitalea sp.]
MSSKSTAFMIAITSLCLTLCSFSFPGETFILSAATVDTTIYKLVWSEEFNTPGQPDPSKWQFEKGLVRNEEHQWYQEANAWCENGNLIIEGRKETRPNPYYKPDAKDWRSKRKEIYFSSSSLNTAKSATWLYGRFEMRGKIDISSGLWPAWWTLGVSENWPANGEIDIMEFYRGKLLANIAFLDSNGKAAWYATERPVDSMGGKSWAEKFHVWRMDWDENAISLYVDDVLLNTVAMDKLHNRDASAKNPFKQKHYMLLNLALGGINGGSLENTRFPNRFEVDYVRVYQKQ